MFQCFLRPRPQVLICAGPQLGFLQNTGVAPGFNRHLIGSTWGNGGGMSSDDSINTSWYSHSNALTCSVCSLVSSFPILMSLILTVRRTIPYVLCAAMYSATILSVRRHVPFQFESSALVTSTRQALCAMWRVDCSPVFSTMSVTAHASVRSSTSPLAAFDEDGQGDVLTLPSTIT